MKTTILALSLSTMALTSCATGGAKIETQSSVAAPSTTAEKQADFAVKTFLEACMGTFGQAFGVEVQARQLEFGPVAPSTAAFFLGGKQGKVWSQRNDLGAFAIAHRTDGICSVFARKADPQYMKVELESWLPPSSKGYRVRTRSLEGENGLRTYFYAVTRNGQPVFDWVLSTSADGRGGFQGVASFHAR